MDKPRTTSDVAVAFCCRSCSGLGKTGSTPCGFCNGSGWEIYDAQYLKPEQLQKLHKKLPQLPQPPTTTPTNGQPE